MPAPSNGAWSEEPPIEISSKASLRARSARSSASRTRPLAVDVAHRVGRADHVEVDVARDPAALGPAERGARRRASRRGRAPRRPRSRSAARGGRAGARRARASAATPLPLSLMPGPSRTESRCAPSIATRRAGGPGRSAITLRVRRVSATVSTSIRACPRSASAPAPAATAGMRSPGRTSDPRRRARAAAVGDDAARGRPPPARAAPSRGTCTRRARRARSARARRRSRPRGSRGPRARAPPATCPGGE